MADLTEEVQALILLPCANCLKTFRPDVLPRHERVCEKTFKKKRKVFDSVRHRVEGTELAQFKAPPPLPGQKRTPKPPEKPPPPKDKKKWQQTHEALIATVRRARGENVPSSTTADISQIMSADHQQCPSCGRSFHPRSYDRHVEFCKEQLARKRGGPPAQTAASKRLQARFQYKPPLPARTNSNSNFSPASLRPQSLPVASTSSPAFRREVATAPVRRPAPAQAQRLPPATAPMKVPRSPPGRKVEPPEKTNFTRQGSTRRRGVSPTKAPLTRKISVTGHDKAKMKIPACDDKIRTISSESPLNRTFNKKSSFDAISAAAAEQMKYLESWSSDNDLSIQAKSIPLHDEKSPSPLIIDHRKNSTPKKIPTPPSKKSASTSPSDFSPISSKTNIFGVRQSPKLIYPQLTPSPKSSFPKIHSPKSPSPLHASPTSAFSPILSVKNNNCSLDENENNWSDDFCDGVKNPLTSTPHSRYKNRRESISSITSHPSPSALIDEEVLWAHLESQIPTNPNRKKTYARTTSVFDDRNRMLYLQAFTPEPTSSGDDVTSYDVPGPHRPREKTATIDRSRDRKKTYTFPIIATAETEQAMAGGDSAYSSLSRRSPTNAIPQRKIASFCHECGGSYPIATAKFCCLCGVQRLFLNTAN